MGTRSLTRSGQERVFFVYDHQKHGEEADPKDAILFFYPPSVEVKEQIALVGGIVGTVDFCIEVLQHTPSLVSLTSCKFALLKAGPFILGLSSELSAPEQYVTQHLRYLWDTFCLFQGSLLALEQRTGADGFPLELYRVWNCYFSLCQSFCDQLSQAFGAVPYTHLALSQSGVFLYASHILQKAQHQTGVIGGLLLNKNRVLCTQLGSDITRRLLLLMPQERNFPCVELKTDFDLPTGVRLLFAFLTPEELSSLGPRKQPNCQQRCEEQQGQETHDVPSPVGLHHPAVPGTSVPPSETNLKKPVCSLSAVMESVELGEGEEFLETERLDPVLGALGVSSQLCDCESGKGDVGEEGEESFCEANGGTADFRTDLDTVKVENRIQHESSEGDVHIIMKKNDETHRTEENVINTVETIVSSSTSENDPDPERTPLCDEDNAADHIRTEKEDDMCGDGDVQNLRHTWDFSTAEDGGAEIHSNHQSSDGTSTGQKPYDSDSKDADVPHLSVFEKGLTPCRQAEEWKNPLLGNENSVGDDDNPAQTHNHRTDTEEDDSLLPMTTPPTSPLSDEVVVTERPSGNREQGNGHREMSEDHHVEDGADTKTDTELCGAADADPHAALSVSACVEGEREVMSSGSSMFQENTRNQQTVHQDLGGTGDLSASAEDNGNSHYVFPPVDCGGQEKMTASPNPSSLFSGTDLASSSTTVGSPEGSLLSSTSSAQDSTSAKRPTSVPLHPDPKTLNPLQAQGVHFATASGATGEEKEGVTSPASVPLDAELHLDWLHSGRRTSSVLTVSDDLMSPNKERLCFDNILNTCESSGSGSGGGTGSQGSAGDIRPPLLLRECSTEPSSSDLAHSQDTTLSSHHPLSSPSSSTTLLSSPTSSGPAAGHREGEGKGRWAGRGKWVLEGRQRVLLYVQGHMDTLMVLLLEDPALATQLTVNSLWKSSLAKLAELDFAVSDANSESGSDFSSGHSSYHYLKYLKSSRAMQGTATAPVTSLANELVSSSVLLHDTFASMPQATDILCKTHTTCCYGHRSVSSETFFQVVASKAGGFPDPADIAFSLDQSADRKLYADHSSALL